MPLLKSCPDATGLCHISELSNGYINDVTDVCQVGDEMQVLVIDVDDNDRVKLSRRQALEELGIEDEFAVETADVGAGGGGGYDEGYEGGGDRGGDYDRPPRGNRGGGGGGGGRRGGGGGGRSRGGGGGGGRNRGGGGGGGRGRGGNGGSRRGGGGGRRDGGGRDRY